MSGQRTAEKRTVCWALACLVLVSLAASAKSPLRQDRVQSAVAPSRAYLDYRHYPNPQALGLGLGTSAYGMPTELSLVVNQTLVLYRKNGISGLIAISQECYKREKTKLRCIDQDIIASQIDRAFAESIEINRHPYYADEQFFSRATPVFVHLGMSMQQSNRYLMVVTEKVRTLLFGQ